MANKQHLLDIFIVSEFIRDSMPNDIEIDKDGNLILASGFRKEAYDPDTGIWTDVPLDGNGNPILATSYCGHCGIEWDKCKCSPDQDLEETPDLFPMPDGKSLVTPKPKSTIWQPPKPKESPKTLDNTIVYPSEKPGRPCYFCGRPSSLTVRSSGTGICSDCALQHLSPEP